MSIMIMILILFVIFEIPSCFGMGLIFKKMNIDFKKGIIPFYNKVVLIKYYKLPMFHLILIFVPIIGLYTNFVIYSKMCKQYNKEFLYVLELTFFPFIYNIFLGLEIKVKKNEKVDDFFEDQKSLYEKSEKKENVVKQDEYVWHPERKLRSDTVYKASRNKLNAKVNIKTSGNSAIIDNKKQEDGIKVKGFETKVCPKCGAKMDKGAKVCFLCGTKF